MTVVKKNLISRITNNQWIVTIVSTMLGVIFGLYLNNYSERNTLAKAKKNALIQVSDEILENEKDLVDYVQLVKAKYKAFDYLLPHINDDFEIVIHQDSLEAFINYSKNVFSYESSEKYSKNEVEVSGELNLTVDSPLVLRGLSDITWNSYKQTNYLSITKFKCLTEI